MSLDSQSNHTDSHLVSRDTSTAKTRASTIRTDGVTILKESERMTKGTAEDVW